MKSRLSVLGQLISASDLRRVKPAPKAADSHYSTPEHRAWRAEVLRRAGGHCQHPGCTRTGVRLFADHIVELRDGGHPTDPANGQALCGGHHTAKTARSRAIRAKGGG